MSGGSFDYLYRRDPGCDLHARLDELHRMVGELEGFGGTACVERTRAIISAYEHADALADELLDRSLADVWKAVEWARSGDWRRDRALDAVRAFDAKYANASGPGDLVVVAADALRANPPPHFDTAQIEAWNEALAAVRFRLRLALPPEHRHLIPDPEIPF